MLLAVVLAEDVRRYPYPPTRPRMVNDAHECVAHGRQHTSRRAWDANNMTRKNSRGGRKHNLERIGRRNETVIDVGRFRGAKFGYTANDFTAHNDSVVQPKT